MRELIGHKVNPANDLLTVRVMDEVGAGGAHHAYLISGFDNTANPSDPDDQDADTALILFQNGPIDAVGVNGVTHEALIAILIDRLESFQSGLYACDENAAALNHLVSAQKALHSRTLARMARNVEGTHIV